MTADGIDRIAMQDFDAEQVFHAPHSPHSPQTRNGLASETGAPTVEEKHKRWGCSGEMGSEEMRAACGRRCESRMDTVGSTMRETWWEHAKGKDERAEEEVQEREGASMGNSGGTYAVHKERSARASHVGGDGKRRLA